MASAPSPPLAAETRLRFSTRLTGGRGEPTRKKARVHSAEESFPSRECSTCPRDWFSYESHSKDKSVPHVTVLLSERATRGWRFRPFFEKYASRLTWYASCSFPSMNRWTFLHRSLLGARSALGVALLLQPLSCEAWLAGNPEPRDALPGAAESNEETDQYREDAPIRRLTRFEYNNAIKALLFDESRPGDALPAELLGNGFGNDSQSQPVSSFLVESYASQAAKLASTALANERVIQRYAPCLQSMSPPTEEQCVQQYVEEFLKSAFRRPPQAEEVLEWLELYATLRKESESGQALSALTATVLQAPDFLYRVEVGGKLLENGRRQLTGFEVATRLSFLFWGAPPDDELYAAAGDGRLDTEAGILEQAERLLEDERTRETIRLFFSHVLPIQGLTDLARDPNQFPEYSPSLGALWQKETLTFLETEIFQERSDWPSMLTASHSYVNEELASFYGIAGVSGDDFRRVAINPSERLGVLTHGSVLAGSTVSNFTNPVRRGVFLLRSIMCQELPEPPESIAEEIKPPDPVAGRTGRERYSIHSDNPGCASCHAVMDPPGFALENYDALGRWRNEENDVVIDASGELSLLARPFEGPQEMIQQIAEHPDTRDCFTKKWVSFAYGKILTEDDELLVTQTDEAFAATDGSVRSLLLSLTQTDEFRFITTEK